MLLYYAICLAVQLPLVLACIRCNVPPVTVYPSLPELIVSVPFLSTEKVINPVL